MADAFMYIMIVLDVVLALLFAGIYKQRSLQGADRKQLSLLRVLVLLFLLSATCCTAGIFFGYLDL